MKPEDKAKVQQALEAMEVASSCVDGYYLPEGKTLLPEVESAITALRQLLEQPVQGEVVVKSNGHVSPLLTHMMNKRTKAEAQPEPVFCEYCGGNDDADFGLPTDHCTDCARPQPAQPDGDKLSPTDAQPAPVQEPCGWQFYQDGKWHNGMDRNNHRANTEAAGVPVRDVYPEPQPAAWVGLTDDEFNELYDAYEKSNGIGALMQRVEAKLREKNGGA